VRSKGFDANDLGFMSRNNRITAGAHLKFDMLEPYWFGRRSGFNLNAWHHRNLDGDELNRGINYNMWHRFKNDWGFSFGISGEADVRDDLATRGGPVMGRPGSTWGWFDLWTDDRGSLSSSFGMNGHRGHGGANSGMRYSFEVEWRPVSHFMIEVEPTWSRRKAFAQWVENVDDDGDDEDDHFVFGELESRVMEIEGRASYSFTTQLSLQLFVQPFVTTGDYGLIKELVGEKSYSFAPFDGLEENPDFENRSMRSNLVLRWEYRPGSTLFLVWQQSRDRDFEEIDGPEFEPLSGIGKSFTDDGDSIFLVKFNRWFGL
jgi:hypothetical protein